jgi:hypothetical protein
VNDSTQAIATSTNLVLYLTEPRMGLCMEVAAFFATAENGTVRVSRIRHPSPVVTVLPQRVFSLRVRFVSAHGGVRPSDPWIDLERTA